jgi:Putative porin
VTSVALKKGSVVTNVNVGDEIFVGRVFLKYQAMDWLTMEIGKISNPFVATPMLWSPDVNPEGLAEQVKFTLGGGSATPAGYTKDGKEAPAPASSGTSVDVFANFAQFIYDDVGFENNFNTGTGPFTQVPNSSSRWMLGWQIGAKVNFKPDTYVEAAPTLYSYTGGGATSAGPFNGDSPLVVVDSQANPKLLTFNQTGTNDLLVFDIPVEIGFKIGPIPTALFGDFAYNIDGAQRADKAGHPNKENQDIAYQAGVVFGSAKKKGDMQLRAYWQHTDAYSVDQNLVDYNVFDGRTNMEGVVIEASYQLSDGISLLMRYNHGERIDNSLGTPGFGTLGTAPGFPLQRMNFFYVDLTVKF